MNMADIGELSFEERLGLLVDRERVHSLFVILGHVFFQAACGCS
jgi:hypothetical protein